ncbi:MAG: FixH family protein [Cytophagaceae bacterium]
MNWGWSIVLAIVLFMGFITYLVVGTFQQNVDLVYDDYYAREVKFQEQIEKTVNANEKPITWYFRNDSLIVVFPEVEDYLSFNGELVFYRPSDSGKDMKVAVSPNQKGEQKFSRKIFQDGKYRLKVDWEAGGRKYYSEQIIIL